MPYVHLPIQSGSNNILKLMNRRYTKEEYLDLYKKLKIQIPNLSITTDIIVGFPGESDSDFKESLDLVKECKFDGAFTFIFSAREGTPAAKMKYEIPEAEKKERLQRLNKIVNKYSLENNKKTIGSIQKVLITGISEKDENKLSGYTENMKLVNLSADPKYIGQIVDVKITGAKSFSLEGERA